MSHEQFQSCIDACYRCATNCLHCENACLSEQNNQALVRCISLDRDCVEICIFTARMLSASSEFANEILSLCAKVCDACAEECEKHAAHMDHCRDCAESCRDCAEECRSMVNVNVM